ncbi:MAG: mechanosensitive ion channel [Bacteroidales bacterium]|nr:mechanosensitive ion channel [Bacteroidales bacterium]
MKEFLNYQIIESERISISVYSVVIAVVILIIATVILRSLKGLFKRLVKKQRIDEGNSTSFYLIIKYLLWVIIIVLVLETFGVKVSVLLASVAALLVGVGLGLQQLVMDLVSGIILLVERNLKIKDIIQLEDGTVGHVLETGLRTSKIKTRDDIIMIVPNSKFVNDKIINWSLIDEKTRFHVNVGVAYGSDVELVKKVLMECAFEQPGISNTVEPFVRFNDFGNSSLDFQLYFWVQQSFYVENIKSELRFLIDKKFRLHDIRIPFPQRDVHLFQADKI